MAAGFGDNHREPVVFSVAKRRNRASAKALDNEWHRVRVPNNQHRFVIARLAQLPDQRVCIFLCDDDGFEMKPCGNGRGLTTHPPTWR